MLQTEQSRFTGEVCGSEKPIEANERGELSREYYAREMDTRMYLVRRTFTLEQVFPFFPPLSHFFFWPFGSFWFAFLSLPRRIWTGTWYVLC